MVTTTTLSNGVVSAAYTATLAAGGGTLPYTWSITNGSLPAGLTLSSSNGIISGTPIVSGTFNFTARLSDAGNPQQTVSKPLSITILDTLVVTTTTLSNGIVSAAYSATLRGSGGTLPYTWSITNGSLPAGLTLSSSNGIISGTPIVSGTFNFTARLSDAGNPQQTVSKPLSITILDTLVVTTTMLSNGVVSAAYSATLSAGGGTLPYTWSITNGSLPSGLTLSSSNGIISGTPSVAGTFSFTAQVSDTGNPQQTVSKPLNITILDTLVVTTTALSNGVVSAAYTATLSAGGGTLPYTWSITNGSLPAGLMLSSSNGIISGTPSVAGTFSFTAQVSDAGNPQQTVSKPLSITILDTLVVTTTTLSNGIVNTAYSATLRGNGGTLPYTWSITNGSLPAGLTLSSSNGIISGTPILSGTFNFTARLSDAGNPQQTVSKPLSITILDTLVVTTTTLSNGVVSAAYTATLAAGGGTPPYTWSVTNGSLPAGLTLSSSNGIISGTPIVSGTFNFTARLSDAGNPQQTVSKPLSITILDTLVVTTTTLSNGIVSAAYSATLRGSGGTLPYTWSITNGSLPAGLTLSSSNGIISGTPIVSGTFNFTARLSDAGNPQQTVSKPLSITILDTLVVTTMTLSNGIVNTAYSATLRGSGGTLPYTWSITNGSLPAGLTLSSSNGIISGTPTVAGTFSFTARLSDAGNPQQTVSKPLSITILDTLVVTTTTLSNGVVSAAYSATLRGSGGTLPYTWSITNGSLPAGLTLSSSNGIISGTPSVAGTFSFTAQVSDGGDPRQTASKPLSITILDTLVVTTTTLSNGVVSAAYSATLRGSGGTLPYTWSITNGSLPAGLTLSSSNGIISGTPTVSGTFSFTVRLSDAGNPIQIATKSLTIIIASMPAVVTIWSNTTMPGVVDGGPDSAVEVGVKFRSDVAGTINGIRFYKATVNTGAHVGNLWSSTGTRLATVTFTNETASGWQQALFAAPVAIASNTIYIASYHLDNGHYSADDYYFSTKGFDNPPLHALTNGVSGGNGVYAYGASSAFPNQTWNAANYWVDVVFQAESPLPPPTLTSIAVTPANSNIVIGATQQFTATGTYSDSSTQNITSQATWMSSNTGVATINTSGLATGVSTGMTTISATLGSVSNNTTLTVKMLPTLTSIAVTPANSNIVIGASQQFVATGTYSDGSTQNLTSQATWASSNTTVATINSSGLATTLSVGATTISATLTGVTGSTVLTVQSAPLAVTTTTLSNGVVSVAYSVTLKGSGGILPYTWSITNGSLPPGLMLSSSNGTITGMPTTAGAFSFTAQVRDAGNPIQTATKSLSITIASVSAVVTIWPDTTVPGVVDGGADSSVELGVKFKSDVAGTITGIRFYKATANTGSHVGNLWTSAGTQMATVTFTNETASGWQQALFATPVAIASNTIYVASYHVNSGHYSADSGYFSTKGVDNPPLHALTNGVSGGNGVYRYDASSIFPNQTWNAANYWVDVVFQAESPLPPPTLTSIAVTPANSNIVIGASQQFVATGNYSDSSTQNITSQATWMSSNTGVAMINTSGLATGVSTGMTTISATLGSVSNNTTLTVKMLPTLTSIAVTPANSNIVIGASQQFVATGTYSDGSTQNLTSQATWASSNTTVATINSSGLATTLSVGATTISATLTGVTGSTVLTVQSAPLAVTTTTLSNGVVSVAYSVTLKGSGGTLPYTWSITNGSLPPGLMLSSSNGTITGMPTTAGAFSFTAQLRDAGNPIQTATKSLSITIASVSAVVTIWSDTTVPGVMDGGADSSVELGVKFKSDVAGTITGIRFYKATANTGSHVGNLWTSAGTRLATVTFTNETASGWQQALFAAPVAIASNTIYVASYHANSGHYSADSGYFSTKGVDNPPLHALTNGVSGGNGVYRYDASSIFPNQTWNAANYWVDVVFQAESPLPSPTLTSIMLAPANSNIAIGASQQFVATGTYSDSSTQNITSQATWTSSNTTVATINSSGLATTLSVGTTTISATLTGVTGSTVLTVQSAPLTITTTTLSNGVVSIAYSATLKGSGGTLPYTWSITNGSLPPGLTLTTNGAITGTPTAAGTFSFTAQVRDASNPIQTVTKSLSITITAAASSGLILVVTNATNPFSQYYGEILLTEGLNAFDLKDISSVSNSTLAPYDVVILGQVTLQASQVNIISNWVNAGGNLIAMRPDKKLAGLLGLVDASATMTNAYLLVNTSTDPGAGIVGETIQFHGTADRYTLGSASKLATLYSNPQTATINPAVTLRSVGSNGGQVAAFTYDLARSIVYTRQGNPAWVGQDRDGIPPCRSDDLFYGAADDDPQPDWVNLDKVAIPQADEQQRLLANLIITMDSDRNLLPRFWYFPHGYEAVVVMTGDEHGNGSSTASRFDQYMALSPPDGSVDDWETIRSTSYVFLGASLTDAQVAAYHAAGFEIGLHLNTGCADYTRESLDEMFLNQLSQWRAMYPSLPPQTTLRAHCIAWSGYTTMPEVEVLHGIRLDVNYYYYPSNWVADRPGFFTGSGMPMRFATTTGNVIDVYQAATLMTDESGQSYPKTIDFLLDCALGPKGYYGAFVANAHTDAAYIPESDEIIESSLNRGVPVISSHQLLTWLDARNASSLKSINWNNDRQTQIFSVHADAKARGLLAMVPVPVGYSASAVKYNGSPIGYYLRGVKGFQYALFPVTNGDYEVSYVTDNTPPSITEITPTNGQSKVGLNTKVSVTFSEAINASTINTNTITLRDSSNHAVAATVSYNASSFTAVLTPSEPLAPLTNYTVLVKGNTGGVTDTTGNLLANNLIWSFTTVDSFDALSIWSSTAVPGLVDGGPDSAVELGVKFKSDVAGTITGIRFYKATANTGAHVGNLWTSTGTRLATVTFTNETASGWQKALFATPVAIASNTVYIASYHADNGHYSADVNYFQGKGVDNLPLHALADGVSGGNGVYAYGASNVFPNQTWNASYYWVDIMFKENVP